MLQVGSKFPNFSLKNQDGTTKSLADYAGRWLVLYVYPKDDTPGCTIQGKSFTARKDDFDDNETTVVGVSQDDVDSHKSFCNKYSFTFDLLADPEAKLLKAAEVEQVDYKGSMYWERTTFIIDPSGVLKKLHTKVTPEGHERVLLNEIQDLKKTANTPA